MDLGDDDLQPIRVLGEGTFGRVFLCQCRRGNNPRPVCVKRIIVQNPKLEMRMLQEEVYIISQLRHPRIVQFIRSFMHAGTVNIVMEYIANGTIRDVINRKSNISKSRLLQFLLDMLMGLEYLHIRHVTHRDIKPENLLLDSNERIKFVDFGISGIHHSTCKQTLKSAGTPLYSAPEVLRNERFDFKSDVWSLGCVLYEICTSEHPFAMASTIQNLRYYIRMLSRPHMYCSKISKKYGNVIGNLCESMLTYNINKRISLPAIIAIDASITLPFYNQYFDYDYK